MVMPLMQRSMSIVTTQSEEVKEGTTIHLKQNNVVHNNTITFNHDLQTKGSNNQIRNKRINLHPSLSLNRNRNRNRNQKRFFTTTAVTGRLLQVTVMFVVSTIVVSTVLASQTTISTRPDIMSWNKQHGENRIKILSFDWNMRGGGGGRNSKRIQRKKKKPCRTRFQWKKDFPSNDDICNLFDNHQPVRFNHGTFVDLYASPNEYYFSISYCAISM